MKIFLIGLPGSGKTSLAKDLAGILHLRYVDLDEEIVQSEKMPISDIFKKNGEGNFRKAEERVLREWCESDEAFVMATGGGTPAFGDNMKMIMNKGVTVFLDVPSREITRRLLKAGIQGRPLLQTNNPDELKERIEFQRSQRVGFYRQANLTLEGSDITVNDLMQVLRPLLGLEGKSNRN